MMTAIDNFLDRITMYRVALYGLLLLAAVAILFGALGLIPFSGASLLVSLVLFLAVSAVVHVVFATIFRAPANFESSMITAAILFFLFVPAANLHEALLAALVAVLAVASKYLFVFRKKHIFNPAAIAAVLIGLTGFTAAAWWVAMLPLLPFAVVLAAALVRKTRKFHLFASALGANTVTVLGIGLIDGQPLPSLLASQFIGWPIIFFSSVMVTEPNTAPPTKRLQVFYGLFIGVLAGIPFQLWRFFSTPELALVIGNVVFYPFGLARRLTAILKERRTIAEGTFEFVFAVNPPLRYTAGQYLEWTLPHAAADTRGIRRYFTIASSPTEKDLRIGVRMGSEVSTFKKKLSQLVPGDQLTAGPLDGDFVLPKKVTQKLAFIAGGIGITPFRSMIKYLTDTHEHRDIVLFYANRTELSIAYRDLLDGAAAVGVRVIYLVTDDQNWSGERGPFTAELLKRHAPDINERVIYLSGPNAMVESYEKMLRDIKIPQRNIKTDFFPGYA